MTVVKDIARAKVNLTLEVLGKRPDGYHEVASLVAFSDAGDALQLDTSRNCVVTVSGPFSASIAGQNLVETALKKLSVAAPELTLGAVHLDKCLPIAAGIGGGSADAGAVLRVVRSANPQHSKEVDWLAIAKELGADVPVCFQNSAAWMTGIGDVVTAIDHLPPMSAVLVNPLVPMPADKTAQVFRELGAKAMAAGIANATPRPPRFSSGDDLIAYMLSRGNALEAAACRVAPVIAQVKEALLSTAGCRYAAVSGAGPTCFGMFHDAAAAAQHLAARYPGWWVRAVTIGA